MLDILKIGILSFLPISELRGGIPLGLALGLNPILVYFVAVFFNSLAMFTIFSFLDNVHFNLLKNKKYESFFNRYIEKKRIKIEKHIGKKTEFWALLIFVAIPLPMTGAWTGSVLAWFFKVKRLKAYLAILLGVLIAGIIVTLASLGIIALF